MPFEERSAPLGYRLFRALARLALGRRFGKIRVLGPGALVEPGPAIVAVGRAARFEDALLMVAGFERRVRCVIAETEASSPWRAFWLRALGQIARGPGRPWLEPALEALAAGDVVFVFEESAAVDSTGSPGSRAVELALEAESSSRAMLNVSVIPAHLFVPPASLGLREVLVHLSSPLRARERAPQGDRAHRAEAFGRALRQSLAQNAFALPTEDLERFATELEEVLRDNLRDEWAGQPARVRTLDEFELSGLVGQWMAEANTSDPAELVALRHELDGYRSERQRWSLARFQAEAAGWLHSFPARALAAAETLLGFLAALFGLANHLLAGIALHLAGLLNREEGGEDAVRWAKRAGTVLVFYAAQILVVSHLFGRAAAGYYAVALPLSGAYLWRYVWLLRHRTKLLVLSARLSFATPLLRARRRAIAERLDRARDRFAEALGIPHP
jgi:hypothetical protein